jgi:hypothetical protein
MPFWQWIMSLLHPSKVQKTSRHAESDRADANSKIAETPCKSHEIASESAKEVDVADPNCTQVMNPKAKKKNRRGGKGRKGPASSSSTASTAMPDSDSDVAEVAEVGQVEIAEIAMASAVEAEGWNSAPARKQRNQKTKRKSSEENQCKDAAPLVQEDIQSCRDMSARAPQYFEEDLSDECGDLSDLYYSQKGQRHNFRRNDKQRSNHKDATRVAYIVETRMKQSAMDRGLIPRGPLKAAQ